MRMKRRETIVIRNTEMELLELKERREKEESAKNPRPQVMRQCRIYTWP
jgi:hypothetical protein